MSPIPGNQLLRWRIPEELTVWGELWKTGCKHTEWFSLPYAKNRYSLKLQAVFQNFLHIWQDASVPEEFSRVNRHGKAKKVCRCIFNVSQINIQHTKAAVKLKCTQEHLLMARARASRNTGQSQESLDRPWRSSLESFILLVSLVNILLAFLTPVPPYSSYSYQELKGDFR